MWKLVIRGERGSPFTELRTYANLGDAARAVLKTENDPHGAIFFRVYINPSNQPSDPEGAVQSRISKRQTLLSNDTEH
jgi:hypothetical protein